MYEFITHSHTHTVKKSKRIYICMYTQKKAGGRRRTDDKPSKIKSPTKSIE